MRIVPSISLILSFVAITWSTRDERVDKPEVLSAVAPVYPPLLVAADFSGRIAVEVTINAKGEVTLTRIIEGHPAVRQMTDLFDQTLRKWLFSATTDERETRKATIVFVFTIVPERTPEADLTTIFRPPYEIEIRHRPASETYAIRRDFHHPAMNRLRIEKGKPSRGLSAKA